MGLLLVTISFVGFLPSACCVRLCVSSFFSTCRKADKNRPKDENYYKYFLHGDESCIASEWARETDKLTHETEAGKDAPPSKS